MGGGYETNYYRSGIIFCLLFVYTCSYGYAESLYIDNYHCISDDNFINMRESYGYTIQYGYTSLDSVNLNDFDVLMLMITTNITRDFLADNNFCGGFCVAIKSTA